MCEKIIAELRLLAELEFAEWLKPFLSIDETSSEQVIGVRTPVLRKLAKKRHLNVLFSRTKRILQK